MLLLMMIRTFVFWLMIRKMSMKIRMMYSKMELMEWLKKTKSPSRKFLIAGGKTVSTRSFLPFLLLLPFSVILAFFVPPSLPVLLLTSLLLPAGILTLLARTRIRHGMQRQALPLLSLIVASSVASYLAGIVFSLLSPLSRRADALTLVAIASAFLLAHLSRRLRRCRSRRLRPRARRCRPPRTPVKAPVTSLCRIFMADPRTPAARERDASRPFKGALVDTGAEKSCIGRQQSLAYCARSGRKLTLRKPGKKTTFVFGVTRTNSLGTFMIEMKIGNEILRLPVHVVPEDVPFLLGAEGLYRHRMYVDNTRDVLAGAPGPARSRRWESPFVRENGHYVWKAPFEKATNECCFSSADLRKLHRHWRHPSPLKMLSLLQRTQQKDLPPEMLAMLQEIASPCETCQLYRRREVSFGARIQEQCVFNRSVSMDLLYLNSKPVLHVVCRDTSFGAAIFVDTKSKNPTSADIWQAFLRCWVTLYIGTPQEVIHDAGTNFTAKDLQFRFGVARVATKTAGTESHHSNGKVERAHQSLRRVFTTVKHNQPKLDDHLTLALARKGMNDAPIVSGISPTELVF